jgi:succinoglycan biosynthesis protein ExoM
MKPKPEFKIKSKQKSTESISDLKISICIATFNNPDGLLKLLYSINKITFETFSQPKIEIIIVENGNQLYVEEIIKLVDSSRYNFRLGVEPKKGIPFVRNKLVEMALDSHLIAWVDDDEWVTPTWLESLLSIYLKSKCAVVTGPVIGILPNVAPKWLQKSNFFVSPSLETGSLVTTFYTGNALMETSIFKYDGIRFDERLALTGGSDSMLASVLNNKGVKFTWCQEAVVFEDIPEKRISLSWYLLRRYRIGNISALINSITTSRKYTLSNVKMFIRYSYSFFGNFILSIFKGKITLIKSLGYLSSALGVLSHFFSVRYNEYNSKNYRS